MPRLETFIGKTFNFLSPNTWTTISLFIAVGAFFAVYEQFYLMGVLLFAISSFCDVIDGKVARFSNRSSKLGAFWDGTVDRFVDALLILCFFAMELPEKLIPTHILLYLLLFVTLMPPFIVAYANHRGAVPDPTEKVIWRFAFRIEYLILFFLAIGIYPISAKWSYYSIWAGFVLMTATVLQSIILVFIKSKNYEA